MTHDTRLASASHHRPHFTDVTTELQDGEATCPRSRRWWVAKSGLEPRSESPCAQLWSAQWRPPASKGCQEVAGEVRLLGTARGQISDRALEASAGAWVRGRSPGRSEGLQRCLEACLPHSVLVGQGHGPSIVLWTLPAQGPHIRDFRRPGQNHLHFPEKLSPGGRGGDCWEGHWRQVCQLPLDRTCRPGPRDGPPLLKQREEKAGTHFHFRAG